MADVEKVKYDIERCICHVPDACRDCSHYKHGEYLDCMEELLKDALAMLKEQPEIIRCKDCKYGYPLTDSAYYACTKPFAEPNNRKPFDWFCADGERKEGSGK